MKHEDWNKAGFERRLIYPGLGSRRTGRRQGWGDSGVFFPFISEVSSSNVVYLLYSSPFSVHFWNPYRIAFFYLLVTPTSTVAKQQACHENLNASGLPRLWFLPGPRVLLPSRAAVPALCTQGQAEWSSKSLCARRQAAFPPQLTPWHVCSCCVAQRQSPCSGGELSFFHPWPWVCRPWCWAYPWVQLSCRIHFLVHRDFPGFLRVSPQLHHHRLWCGFGCLTLSGFRWCLTSLNQTHLLSCHSHPGCPTFIQLSQVI